MRTEDYSITTMRRGIAACLFMARREQYFYSVGSLLSAVLLAIYLYQPSSSHASEDILRHVQNGGYLVQDSSRTLNHRERDLFIPASTLKILTCLVALENLGLDYRFETHFFLDNKNNLYIKGFGDPFLTSETVLQIAGELVGLGISQIGSLYLDNFSFDLAAGSAGGENTTNPYDAPNGALSVNFNALPLLVKGDGTITSGESQTPLLPLMVEIGAGLRPGFHRVNVNAFLQSRQLSPPIRYTGELFTAQLQQSGIEVLHGFGKKAVPGGIKPLYIHYSRKSLEEIIRECLKFSNNFIANQLFLACGARDFGFPASWEKSRRTFDTFTRTVLNLPSDQIHLEEGSGLSRNNRISPAALLKILDRFTPFSSLLPELNNIRVKTGTLTGVFCYAGYFPGDGRLTPFVILLNQVQNSRKDILEELYNRFQKGRK
jgi:D-alanyl-D-alanine carboxypeptidase/D-alanyl-D-alanine-endopeptidase (penicillin-binding protein 4)